MIHLTVKDSAFVDSLGHSPFLVVHTSSTSVNLAHTSSVRSCQLQFPYVFTIGWDKQVNIWKVIISPTANDLRKEVVLEKVFSFKTAVYDIADMDLHNTTGAAVGVIVGGAASIECFSLNID